MSCDTVIDSIYLVIYIKYNYMETWIIWAILSAITAWWYNFFIKMIAEKGYDSYVVTCYDYLIGAILSWVYLIYYLSFTSIPLSDVYITIGLAFINVLFFSLSILTRVEWMRNIDTVIFFPLYKTFGPIFVTIIWVLYYQEALSIKEYLGIIIGITIPLLLINKTENRIQKNLVLGVILVIATSILTLISTIWIKELMLRNLSIELFIFASFVIGIFLSLIWYEIHKKKSKKRYQTRGVLKFSIWLGIVHLISFITFVKAMAGVLAIVFTINSFSILVPIVLSIVFYGEHFNFKKWVVILLSIVSILFFI